MAATIVNGIKLAANVEQGDDGRGIDPESLPPAHPQRDTHKFDSSEQYTQVMGSDYRLIQDDIPFQQAPVVIFQTANFVETRSNIECFIALFCAR